MAYNIRVGEAWHPSFPDADPFTRYSTAEEATILDIKTNSENTKYVKVMIDNRIEIMDAFLFIRWSVKHIHRLSVDGM